MFAKKKLNLWLCLFYSVLFIALPSMVTAAPMKERLALITNPQNITIDTQYDGARLYITGMIDNLPKGEHLGENYPVIITIEGPKDNILLRKKAQKYGIWQNSETVHLQQIPLYHFLASSAPLDKITSKENYAKLQLGASYLPLAMVEENKEKEEFFRQALIQEMQTKGLFVEKIGKIAFKQDTFFNLSLYLPPNAPSGLYKIKAYLFHEGEFITQNIADFSIKKSHFTYFIYKIAHFYSFFYGLLAVAIAIFVSLTARFFFKKN